jgi:hypothetical protein
LSLTEYSYITLKSLPSLHLIIISLTLTSIILPTTNYSKDFQFNAYISFNQFIMYASSILLTLGALLATSFAAPAPVEGTLETSIVPFGDSLNPRDKSAIITTYSGDTCNGNNSGITLVGGGNRGTNVDNMRSISALGR